MEDPNMEITADDPIAIDRDSGEAARHGRPTGPIDEDGLRPGRKQEDVETIAPEERGHDVDVEHAPGADL
jgi:hypothetical protein